MPRPKSKKVKKDRAAVPIPARPPSPEEKKMELDTNGEPEGDGVDGEEEETQDFGPEFNPTHFEFLIGEKSLQFYEGQFQLNRPFKAAQSSLENPHGAVKLFQGS